MSDRGKDNEHVAAEHVAAELARPNVKKLQDDRRCFACGRDNTHGLQLEFEYGDGSARATLSPAERFSGWSAMIHGGIVMTLLDEAMAHAAIAAGVRAMTARIEARFRKVVPIGVPLILEGKMEKQRGRVLDLVASLSGEDGTLYAEARGRFLALGSP